MWRVACETSGGRPKSGYDIVQELVSQGLPGFKDLKEAQATSLASMYDSYKREMAWSEQWDFDDILHDCLALLHHHPEVRDE